MEHGFTRKNTGHIAVKTQEKAFRPSSNVTDGVLIPN